jgi:hypothetical protein
LRTLECAATAAPRQIPARSGKSFVVEAALFVLVRQLTEFVGRKRARDMARLYHRLFLYPLCLPQHNLLISSSLITGGNFMLRVLSISVAIGIALAACGGGGGGGGGGTPAPAPSPVALDSANYTVAASEAVSSSLFVLDAPSLALGVETSDAYAGIRFGLAKVPSLGSWFTGAPVAVGVVESETMNCAVQGTITLTATDADNNGALTAGDSVSIAATNCSDDSSSVINGAITFSVETLSGDLSGDFYNASLKLSYNNLKVSTAGSSVTANGDLLLSANSSGLYAGSQSIKATSLTVSATYGSATYSRTLSNFDASLALASNSPISTFKTTSTVSGTVASSALGNMSVTIATGVPFVRLSTDAYASSGQATLTGSTAAKVRLTAQNATTVLIELDANGDGTYETSVTKSWAELR